MEKTQEVIEGNKLIAEFHGKYNTKWHTIGAFPENQLKYHSSWDWLMPVVEKIESLDVWVIIKNRICVLDGVFMKADGNNKEYYSDSQRKESKIEACWLEVVKFIEVYNSYNSNPQTNKR